MKSTVTELNRLSRFLVKAKLATYASGEETNKRTLEDGAKELTFKEGNLKK